MAKFLGKNFVVQVGDVATPTNFQTVAAMRTTSVSFGNAQIDVTEKDVAPYRELMEGGIRSIDITLAGPISDAATLATLRAAVATGQIRYFRITSGVGDSYTMKCQVVSLDRAGEFDKEETYSIKLMSSGTITVA